MTKDAATSGQPAVGKRLALPAKLSLTRGLVAAWSDMLAHAAGQVERAPNDPVVAVHEFRKSIRRTRSMLRLLRHSLPKAKYKRLRIDLRALHRSTSRLRDRHVVLHTLTNLSLPDELAEPVRAHISVAEPTRPDDALAALLETLDDIEAARVRLKTALPRKVRWRMLTKDLQDTYRRARKDMRATARGRDDDAVHDWRKRTKELVYQVELLTHGARKGHGRKLRRQLAGLAETLGQVIDLETLASYVTQHVPHDAHGPLLRAIERARRGHQRQALATGKRLFKKKPGQFTRRFIAKSKRAHKAARS